MYTVCIYRPRRQNDKGKDLCFYLSYYLYVCIFSVARVYGGGEGIWWCKFQLFDNHASYLYHQIFIVGLKLGFDWKFGIQPLILSHVSPRVITELILHLLPDLNLLILPFIFFFFGFNVLRRIYSLIIWL